MLKLRMRLPCVDRVWNFGSVVRVFKKDGSRRSWFLYSSLDLTSGTDFSPCIFRYCTFPLLRWCERFSSSGIFLSGCSVFGVNGERTFITAAADCYFFIIDFVVSNSFMYRSFLLEFDLIRY